MVFEFPSTLSLLKLCRAQFHHRNFVSLSSPLLSIDELWKGGYLDPTISAAQKNQNARSGDAWPSKLLRLKSFQELQQLWYTTLKEKNLLLGERSASLQLKSRVHYHGRLKKCKLTMKRILGVISERENHEKCLRAQELLAVHVKHETLEQRKFLIHSQILDLSHKIERLETDDAQRISWASTLNVLKTENQKLELALQPLRIAATQFLEPDWRYQKKYSDLPGHISWKREMIPALGRRSMRAFRAY